MTTSYLLPCDCGQVVVVQPRQAGQEVRCTCGKSLVVPTMLKMTKLQQAESPSEAGRTSSRWGWRQSTMVLGAAVVLGTIMAGVHIARSRPEPPPRYDSKAIRDASRNLTPLQAWQQWQYYRVNGLNRQRLWADEQHEESALRWWLKVGVLLLLFVAGLGLIVVPPLIRQQPRQQPNRADPNETEP